MADKKVSDLPSLNGADVDPADLLYIVDSSAGAAGSKKITVGQYQLAPVSGGTANTVVYLNGSKVESSSSALTFDGTNFATTGTSSAAKLIPTGGTAIGNGMYLPAANTLAWSNNGAETMRLDSSGNLGLGVTPSAWGNGVSMQGSGWALSTTLGTDCGAYYVNARQTGYAGIGSSCVYRTTAPAGAYGIESATHKWFTAPSGTAGNAISFTQAMTLDATGRLDLTPGSGNNAYIECAGGTNTAGINSALFGQNSSSVAYFWNRANEILLFGTNNTERMRLDASGNLGLGVTPSAWGSGWKSYTNQLYGEYYSTNGGYVGLASNAYYNGANWIYKNTTRALRFESDIPNGAHVWYTAPSGTAGNTISFTQAMTLDASGNLAVGITTTQGKVNIQQSLSGTYGSAGIWLTDNSTTSMLFNNVSSGVSAIWASGALTFGTGSNNNTERARITSGGDLLVGTTSALTGFTQARLTISGTTGFVAQTTAATNEAGAFWNAATAGDNVFVLFGTETTHTLRGTITYNRAGGLTAYNTTSDYRAKDIIGPVQNPGATIDALKVYEGVMKGATQSRPMLIAHEAQEHAPYAVSGVKDEVNEDGTPKFQQMDVSSLVPLLLAEIQSLRARVAALEAK